MKYLLSKFKIKCLEVGFGQNFKNLIQFNLYFVKFFSSSSELDEIGFSTLSCDRLPHMEN